MHLPWPEPSWFYAIWFAVNWPTFGPKGKAKASAAEKEAALRAEVIEFQRLHPGERPKSRSSLYEKLRRAGALHLLEAREAETEEQRRQRLKQEVEAYLAANDGRRPARTSSLYVKLQKAGALDLLEKATVAQSPEERRGSLEKEVEAYLAANDGRRPARTSSLYVKLQKAGALDLLDKATVAQSPEERRESLEKEVEAYLAANDGRRPARTSSLYMKLQKAGALDLLEKATVTQSPEERRESLEKEVEAYLAANDGRRPARTSSLYTKLQKAGLLGLLPLSGSGVSTAQLDAALRAGVLNFLKDKTIFDGLHMLADLSEESLQRYSPDILAHRRVFLMDVILAVTRGLEPAGKFGMTAVSSEEQVGAYQQLEEWPLLTFDDTRQFRDSVRTFCDEKGRFPDKDGGDPLDKALLSGIAKVRARRFGPVVQKRQGTIIDFALPLREEQMFAWETLPHLTCFIWWPHHACIYDEVMEMWRTDGVLPTRGPQSSSDALAQKVRRVRSKTILPGRRGMRPAEQEKWESSFGSALWQRRMEKEPYIPQDALTDRDTRWQISREPQARYMLACELCGFEMNTRKEFRKHVEEHHVGENVVPAASWTPQRVVEEYRKRMVYYEQAEGWVEFIR